MARESRCRTRLGVNIINYNIVSNYTTPRRECSFTLLRPLSLRQHGPGLFGTTYPPRRSVPDPSRHATASGSTIQNSPQLNAAYRSLRIIAGQTGRDKTPLPAKQSKLPTNRDGRFWLTLVPGRTVLPHWRGRPQFAIPSQHASRCNRE